VQRLRSHLDYRSSDPLHLLRMQFQI
jgi:hypothetical protein